jgi:cytochrome c-type biogenesis protein CcmH
VIGRRLVWVALGLVLVIALAIGSRGSSGPATEDQRVHRVAAVIRCPTCRGLSAAQSDAPAAESIRDEIRRRVQDGETDRQIKDYLVSRYGDDILLDPEAKGVGLLVWALPLLGAVAAVTGVVLVLRRNRIRPGRRASAADRALVDEALLQ